MDIITPDTQELMIMPGFVLITKIIKKIGLDIKKNILSLWCYKFKKQIEMKVEVKNTGMLNILSTLFCLFLMIVNSITGWWYLSYSGFSVKQLLINVLVSSLTLFYIWIVFTKVFIIKINKIE